MEHACAIDRRYFWHLAHSLRGGDRPELSSKSLTMIIPFAAGGPTDVLGRVIARRMSEIMGQQVVVENVGGAPRHWKVRSDISESRSVMRLL
jgi:hypothetical protein